MELLDFLVRNASKKKWNVVNTYPSDMPINFPFNYRGSVDEIPDDIAFGDIYELRSDYYVYAKKDNDTLYRILPEPTFDYKSFVSLAYPRRT